MDQSMIPLLIFLLLIPVFILHIVISKQFDRIAYMKGHDDSVHAFAKCFWFGIAGYLYVIALPDRNICFRIKKVSDDFDCPFCNNSVSSDSKFCPYCGKEIDWS